MLCHADEEDGVCLFTDIAVASQGSCLRLARGAAGGYDEQAGLHLKHPLCIRVS